MAKNTRHSELVSESNKGGESLAGNFAHSRSLRIPLARTRKQSLRLLSTPSSGGHPRNAPDLPHGFDFANAKSIIF